MAVSQSKGDSGGVWSTRSPASRFTSSTRFLTSPPAHRRQGHRPLLQPHAVVGRSGRGRCGGGWTLSGTTGAATVTYGNVPEGTIVLTADATASCNPTLQRGSASAGANFLYSVGKRMWCFARGEGRHGRQHRNVLRPRHPDTSPIHHRHLPERRDLFEKAAAATVLDFHARKDGTSTEKPPPPAPSSTIPTPSSGSPSTTAAISCPIKMAPR